ncbi:MAG: hypothetical protein RIR33_1274 [Pseudomonadota bacterium]|jgi:hypothetical protein
MTRRIEGLTTGPSIPTVVDHRLPAYFASDEALIDILERYPAELFDITHQEAGENLARPLAIESLEWADGRAALDAVKTGRLSIVLHACEEAHPGLWAEVMRSFANLPPWIGTRHAHAITGRLVISSPTVAVPYRFEADGAMLFHLRGVKRVWIYPQTDAFLPQDEMESAILHKATHDLRRTPHTDAEAYRFEIVPGQALAWQLHAPHRMENPEGLCVSLMANYQSLAGQITTGAHRANGVLRKRGWSIRPLAQTGWAHRTVLWSVSHIFAILGMAKGMIDSVPRTLRTAAGPPQSRKKSTPRQTATA